MNLDRIALEHLPLGKVLMHRPGRELEELTQDNLRYYNFAAVPDCDRFVEEFDRLAAAIRAMGAEVMLLSDMLAGDESALDYMGRRPNMTYTRDLAVMSPSGAILMGMAMEGRKGDPEIVGKALSRAGVPIAGRLDPQGVLEGGGISYFGGDTVVVGRCDRTNTAGLAMFASLMRKSGLRRMVTIPCRPGTVHIDGFLLFIDRDLALADPSRMDYGPAEITDLESGARTRMTTAEFLESEGVECISVSEERDGFGAANFVVTAPRRVVGYEWTRRVMREIEKRGGTAVGVPGGELRKGLGGPHCMTCALERSG